MPRHSKRSPERETAILNALRAGNTRRAAIAFAEIDQNTFYRWMEREGTFRDAVEKAEAEAEVHFELKVRQAAATSWQAAAWWLERRRREDYGRSARIEIKTRIKEAAREAGLDPRDVFAEVAAILGEDET